MQQIQVESVLGVIDTTSKTIKGIKTVCKNHDSVTKYVQNPNVKKNIKETAEHMYTFIENCEQKVDECISSVKNKFKKLTDDVDQVTKKFQPYIDELNQWLEIDQLKAEFATQKQQEISFLSEEFPNIQKNFNDKNSFMNTVNLYLEAIQRKIEKLTQKLYDSIQEWVEKQISKLKKFVDPYLKKLKEFGNQLLDTVNQWIGKQLDWIKDSTLGQYAVTGYELAKGIAENFPDVDVEEFVDGISLDFDNLEKSMEDNINKIGNLVGQISDTVSSLIQDPKAFLDKLKKDKESKKENDDKFPQKIQDSDENKEGTFKEGVFTDQDDPNSARFNAPEGMGVKDTDPGGGTLFTVPTTQFNPQYTKNFPTVTPGGHLTELDDTPGSERSLQYHPAGTSTEVQPDGQKVNRIVGDKFEVIERNGNIQINGVCNIQISGDARMTIGGDAYQVISGNAAQTIKGNSNQTIFGNAEQEIKGNAFQYTRGNVKQQINGNVIQEIKGDSNQKVNGNIWQQVLGNAQQHIKGNSQQIIQGNLKQIIDGNAELSIKGNSHQFIDGNAKLLIKGDSSSVIQGSCIQKINGDLYVGVEGNVVAGVQGTLGAKVSGNATLNLESDVNAQVGGNMNFRVGGEFNLQSQQTVLESSGETTIRGSRISLN